jgi:hypothetical protein
LYTYSRQPRERLRPRRAYAPGCKFKRRERVCAESSRPLTVSYSLRSCEFLGDLAGRYPAVGWRAQTRERPERHKSEAGIWFCLGPKRWRKAPECRCMTQTACLPPACDGRTALRGPALRGLVICLYKPMMWPPPPPPTARLPNCRTSTEPSTQEARKRPLKTCSVRLGVVSNCWKKNPRPNDHAFFSSLYQPLLYRYRFYHIPASLYCYTNTSRALGMP